MTLSLDVTGLGRSLSSADLRFSLRAYARVGSTQDLVAQAARAGAAEGLVILADEQLSGRGRSGRSWIAPPGTALMFSVLLRPRPSTQGWATLSLVAGLALAEGLALAGGPAVRLKWPNDCLCGDRKLAGILAEAAVAEDRSGAVVLGVGCNVTWLGMKLPRELRRFATACDLEGYPLDRTRLAEAVLSRLATRYRDWAAGGFAALRQEWLSHGAWLGEEVVAEHHSGQVSGRLLSVSDVGELILETPAGAISIAAGELGRARGRGLRLAGGSPG